MNLLRRTRPALPAEVVAQVAAQGYASLGTYPEAVLAVTGCYPQRNRYERRVSTGDGPPFARLDPATRRAAMQAALDGLIAGGTLDLPPGTPLEDAVSDGLRGRLRLTGSLGALAGVCLPMHKDGYRTFCVWSHLDAPKILGTAYSFDRGPFPMALVETPDHTTGDYSYALATVPVTAAGMGPALFTDPPGADARELTLLVVFGFRVRGRLVRHRLILTRRPGDANAAGGIAQELPVQSAPAPVNVDTAGFVGLFETFWSTGAAGSR